MSVAALLVFAIGCGSSSNSSPSNAGKSLVVTASPNAALADGTSSVLIHVEGTARGPVNVITNRGTFESGSTVATFDAAPIDVVLKSCDAAGKASCAGAALVQAVDADLVTGSTVVTFAAVTGGGATTGSDAGATDGGSGATDGGSSTTTGKVAVALTTSATRIAADGNATATLTASVTLDGSAANGRALTFAQVGSGATLSATSRTTDASGAAVVVLTSAAAGGTAVVTVTDTVSGELASVVVAMPRLGGIALASQQYAVQGVASSGFQETNQLTFQLVDTSSKPYPAGLAVSFSHASLGGSFVGDAAACTAAAPAVCTWTGATDEQGTVTVKLNSGRTAGAASVAASATAGGLSASAAATNVAVVGAKSSGAHLTVDCTPKNIPALADEDCSYSHYVGAGNIITCTATFADRFNNVLGVPTLVTFASEAGAAGPPATTRAYDSSQDPTGQTGLGVATNFVNVSGGTLPFDVTPFAGEASLLYTDACGARTHNPRDGLVTVVAMANGEEGFVDLNANGKYDPGEPFIDLGEPYIDANDNGQWDPGEPFVDVNGNGAYDGPNGKWDSDTVVWAETRVLYTGVAEVASTATLPAKDEFSRFFGTGTPLPGASTAPAFAVLGSAAPATSQVLNVAFMDGNFNELASSASYAVAPRGKAVTAAFGARPSTIDDLGMSFTQQYCDKQAKDGPTSCSNTCKTAPCYVVTNVGGCNLPARTACNGFSYGKTATAVVTGACTSAAGDSVDATATVAGLGTTISLAGSCASCGAGQTLCSGACVDTLTDAKNCGVCGFACSGSQSCQAGGCVDPGGTVAPVAVSVATSAPVIAADGVSTATITATITVNGVAAAGRTVSFAQTGSAAALVGTPPATDANGKTFIVLRSDAAGGVAVVTATDDVSTQRSSVSVTMPRLGQVNLVAQQYQVQGVRFSGFQETNQLTFKLLDTAGQPYPAGLAVSFSHGSLGGSYLGASASCTAAPASMCSATGATDASGQVTVLVTSGRTAGVAAVTATATAGGLTASGVAPNLAVVGAKSSGAHITLDCSPRNVPALTDDDCNFSHYTGPGNVVTCTASFADRFNNVLGVPTLVTFESEAGSAGPPATTPAYDSTKPPISQTGLGVATDFINVTGGKLPIDVPPFSGEFSQQFATACGNLTHNPRDGVVTVIAMANGEEGFVDQNGNGKYDPGEPFIDMGEPYVDENDNGQWDLGEPFVDVNGNGAYDGPNGVWDANTVIWAETRIVYTGFPGGASRIYDPPPAPPGATPVASFALDLGLGPTAQSFGFYFADENFNAITPTATYTLTTLGSGVVSAKLTDVPTTLQNIGMDFTQQYCDKPAPAGPTQCANVCKTAPCYVVTNVGQCDLSTTPRSACKGFNRGSFGDVLVTGTCSNVSSDTVRVTATMNKVDAFVDVSGSCTPPPPGP